MAGSCGCETEGKQTMPELGCLDCGAACCPACAIQLESATYCQRCAGSLLETFAVRSAQPFDLH